jgi:hypothetical protein
VERQTGVDSTFYGQFTTTSLTPTLTGQTAGTAYRVRVAALNQASLTFTGADISVTTPWYAPTGGQVTAVAARQVSGDFTAVVDSDEYRLTAARTAANPPTDVAGTTVLATPSGTVAGLTPNTLHHLFAQACRDGVCSYYVALGSTVTAAAVARIASVQTEAGGFRVVIDANGNPAGTTYVLEVKGPDDVAFHGVSTGTALTVGVTGLTVGQAYQVRVIARSLSGTLADPSEPAPAFVGAGSLATSRAFPVPFRPSSGGALTLDRLPSEARVRIFNIRGDWIRDLQADALGQALWDGRTSDGESAPGGVYVARVQGGGRRSVKFVLER